jgi:hypothetical protein
MLPIAPIGAPARFVIASATARRADAGDDSSATGGRSPSAITSPA